MALTSSFLAAPPMPLRLPDIARLSRRRERDARGLFLVEGIRSVESAVEAGARLTEVLVTAEAAQAPRVAVLLRRAGCPVREVAARELAKVSEVETAQGIVALAELPPEPDLRTARRVLALDGVQDPGNVGTLVRTAAWFGLDAVVAGHGTADFFAPKVVRSAMGGLWDVGLARTDDLAGVLGVLRAGGFTVYGAALDGTPVAAWRPAVPAVLVLGAEAHGLSADVAAVLDAAVTIPVAPARHGTEARRGTESLNVAVAGGVLLYQWQKSEIGER